MTDLAWMAWTWQTALFFVGIASLLLIMTAARGLSSGDGARRHPAHPDDARRPAVHLAARRGLHPSRLAGARRPKPVVGSRPLAALRGRRCSAASEGRLNELSGSIGRREQSRSTSRSITTGRRLSMASSSSRLTLLVTASALALALGAGTAVRRHGRGPPLGRQRVPALDALQGRAAEGDGMVRQCGQALRRHGDQGRLRDHHDA